MGEFEDVKSELESQELLKTWKDIRQQWLVSQDMTNEDDDEKERLNEIYN